MSQNLLTIFGAYGEGGGQVLRSALTLALVTGRPFRLVNIRAGRKRPSLRPQHLAARISAAGISGARCTGDMVDSTELTFIPATLTPGNYPGRYRHRRLGSFGTAEPAAPLEPRQKPPIYHHQRRYPRTLESKFPLPRLAMGALHGTSRLFFETALATGRILSSGRRHHRSGYRRQRQLVSTCTSGTGPLLDLRIISLVSNLPESIAHRQADWLVQRLRPCGIKPSCEIVQQP